MKPDSQNIEQYPFYFSIIMAVYNVRSYLGDAVNSLLQQTLPFENIQLILVDDGSTDGSGALCDKYKNRYPDSVIVIHQENAGQSAARNAGIKYAKGRYMNFMDPDDMLEPGVLEGVYHFFIQNEQHTDVVAIPMMYFEALSGNHVLNYKFKNGNGVVSLLRQYDAIQLSASSAFFAHDAAKSMTFDTRLVTAEDAKEVLKVLCQKCTLGLYRDHAYLYRRRTAKDSTLQTATLKHDWYCEQLTSFNLQMLNYCQDLFGYVPLFAQYTLTFDLHWRFKQTELPADVLTILEQKHYVELLKRFFEQIDNTVILHQKSLLSDHKFYAMCLKYGREPQLAYTAEDVILHFDGQTSFSLQACVAKIDFIRITEQTLFIEGLASVLWDNENQPEKICSFLKIGNTFVPCQKVSRNGDKLTWFRKMYHGESFRCEIDLLQNPDFLGKPIMLYTQVNGFMVARTNVQFQSLSPFNNSLKNQYYYKNHYSVCFDNETKSLVVRRCTLSQRLKLELRFSKELWSKKNRAAKKAVAVRWAVFAHKLLFPKQKIWLISDKASRADDNGEAFFKFIRKKKASGVKPYFVISNTSPDYQRMCKYGKVIPHMSARLKFKHLLADAVLSAHTHAEIQNPFKNFKMYYQDLMSDCKMVFLQHGITYNDISSAIHKYRKNYRLITAASPREYDGFIRNNKYGYTADEISLTGFARYDYLYNAPKKKITIMPTWRRSLFDTYDAIADQWSLSDNFEYSKYYRFFCDLLTDKRLLDAAQKKGYQIQFLPHPVLFPYIDYFKSDERVKILGRDTVYRQIFAESDLILTDYSSAVFDFAYLNKPIIYMFFDSKEFFGTQYSEGYFTIEKDGFGEVEYTLEDTVTRIIEYMDNACGLKNLYKNRINEFYKHHDKNNCERIYNALINIK